MMNQVTIKGAVPVLLMAFDQDGVVDDDSMRRQIDFCIDAGSDALAFGWGTESHLLTDREREQAWTVAALHTDNRVPLIAATTHPAPAGVLALTKIAKDCGADAAMVNPEPLKGERLVRLYRDLSEEVGLPLVFQDAKGNTSAADLVTAVSGGFTIASLKIESLATPHKMGIVRDSLDSTLTGSREVTILGGSNGALLLEELDRGSVGTMPHPVMIDAFKHVCKLHESGNRLGAWKSYTETILPVARLVQAAAIKGGSLWLHKYLFMLAGIFSTDLCRMETATPPAWVMEQLLKHFKNSDLVISDMI
jgi:4-hydroxy-tetrahydrodipicolinate synthase